MQAQEIGKMSGGKYLVSHLTLKQQNFAVLCK